MSGHVGNLSDTQAALLAEFKERVKDISKPEYDDYFFTRWLRARNFDLKKSEAMLRNHIEWRAQNNVDSILQDFKPPEVVEKYYTGGLFGQDKQGALIWIEPAGFIDLRGILMSVKKQDVIKSKIWLLEHIYLLFEKKSKEQNRRVDQMVIIFDLYKFGMKHLWKPGMDVFTDILTVFEDHYPETLKKTFVINAPRIFPIAYSAIRPFLSEETQRKVAILGPSYKEILAEHIDADQLPKHWGGTYVDKDGDPRCPSKIGPGGDVPSAFFAQNCLIDLTGFTEVSIGRGSTHQLELPVSLAGSIIRWQFKTDGFDIGFGVYKRTSDKRQKAKDMDTVLELGRVNSHMVPEDGSVQCMHTGTYILRFDNTYSWTRGKKLFYTTEVLEPSGRDNGIPRCESSQSMSDQATAGEDAVFVNPSQT
ncbi:hypothetical protein RRG08_003008 [Elysia crispata]|uniref:SEC14-like protein 2 n=1 Tax=Elysia crispata TaxID=231223 RepID=A0AAE1B6L7_9GAST|nr:hypothetical protein RRG08_003008 [Elysia crispata]